jgi:hypothetical protein
LLLISIIAAFFSSLQSGWYSPVPASSFSIVSRLLSSRRETISVKTTIKMTTKRNTTMVEDVDRDSVSIDKEAQTTSHQIKPGMTAEDAEWLASIPPQEQARIYHKVDRRLVPMLALL